MASPPIVQPSAPQPTPDPTAQNPNITVHLDESGLKDWAERLSKAKEASGRYDSWRDQALKNYAPQVTENPKEYALDVRTNRAFRTVERKRGDLFYQRPDLTVEPSPLIDAIPQATDLVSAHAAIVNELLSEDGVNAAMVMARIVFDYEVFGEGWSKIGYRNYTKPVQQNVPQIDPATGQPQIDPMTQQPVMTMQTVPVPIKSECYWEHFGPKQGLLPHDARHNDYDKHAWIGWRGEMPLRAAKRMAGASIPDDFKPSGNGKETRFDHGGDGSSGLDTVQFTEVFYKSAIFRDDIVHPDHITQIMWIEGIKEPVIHRDSPDQSFDDRGRLTADSLIGFPICPIAIRVLTDSARILSDVMVGLPQTQELDKYRQGLIQQRDINKLRGLINGDVVPAETVNKISFSGNGMLMIVPGEVFNSAAIKWLEHGAYPQENFGAQNLLANDYDQTMGVDASAAGVETSGSSTATEVNLNQANRNVRTGTEANASANFFIRTATKFATLVQRYYTVEDAAAIVGQERAQLWDSFRRQVPARIAFTMIPDSALRNDTPLHKKQFQDYFTFVANDPNTNRRYLAERYAELNHLDPSKALLAPDQVPHPKPDPPKLSISVTLVDLINPLITSDPNVQAVLKQCGIELVPTPPQMPPHGGAVAPIESLSKHATDQTFGSQNTGVPSEQGPTRPPIMVQ